MNTTTTKVTHFTNEFLSIRCILTHFIRGGHFQKEDNNNKSDSLHNWIFVNKMQMSGLLHSSQILCWKYKEILSHLSKQQIIPHHYCEHRALQQSFVKSKGEVNYTICNVVECKYGYRQSLLRIFDNIVSFPDKGNSPYVYSNVQFIVAGQIFEPYARYQQVH